MACTSVYVFSFYLAVLRTATAGFSLRTTTNMGYLMYLDGKSILTRPFTAFQIWVEWVSETSCQWLMVSGLPRASSLQWERPYIKVTTRTLPTMSTAKIRNQCRINLNLTSAISTRKPGISQTNCAKRSITSSRILKFHLKSSNKGSKSSRTSPLP